MRICTVGAIERSEDGSGNHRRAGSTLVLVALLAAWSGVHTASAGGNATELFSTSAVPVNATLTRTGRTLRSRSAVTDLSLLDHLPVSGQGTLQFNLFDDATFTGHFTHFDAVSTPSQAWWGTLDETGLGTFTLIRNESGMLAVIRTLDKGVFEIRAGRDGTSTIRETDVSGIRCGGAASDLQATAPASAPMSSLPASLAVAGATQQTVAPLPAPPAVYGCDDGTVIDIMVTYTTQARISAGGTANMNNNIALAIANANAAFNRSLISTSLHLVYTYESSYTETGNYQTDTNAYLNFSDGQMDDIPPLRDFYGADCISLWMDTYNGFGYGYFPDSSLQGIGASGLTLMDWRGYNGLLLAHETGHNLWCDHDHAHATSLGNEYSLYSFGYTEPGDLWQDIMAQTPGAPQIPYYANPNVTWPGPNPGDPGPIGVTIGQPNASDLATTITQTRQIVANFRATATGGLPSVLYADASASAGGNGLSWATAFHDLQDALCRAAGSRGAVTQIWVAAGTYKPDRGTGDRSASFYLQNNLVLYGGFSGTETQLSQRNPATNIAILSGDLGVGGDMTDNSYHVVSALDVNATAQIDGFTITGGNANSATYPGGYGGGMHVTGGSPSIANCTFAGNSANEGGGLYNENGSAPALTNCTFTTNSASDQGGGLHNDDSSPIVRNCTFVGNTAATAGGAYNTNNSPASYANCRFFGNQALQFTGGAFESDGTSPTLVNCLFSGNQCNWYGGGLVNYGAGSQDTKIINCTFSRNNASIYGGAIAVDTSGPTLANTILWNNTAFGSNEDIQIVRFSSATVTFDRCIVQGWTGSLGGTANNGSDPLFINDAGPDNTPGTTDDNLRLSSGSPAIDTGDNTALPPDTADLNANGNVTETTPYDLDNHPRVLGTTVDRGAYEFVPVIPGDFDHDGDVDATDLLIFEACAAGPAVTYSAGHVPAGCTLTLDANGYLSADFDKNHDVDQVDFAVFQRCWSGAGVAASPNCR